MLFPTLAFLVILINFINPTVDTDFGWHYRCGADLLTSGELCLENRFSYFLQNYHWGYSSLIYDLSLAMVYQWMGFWGVAFLAGLVILVFSFTFYQVFHQSRTVFISLGLILIGSFATIRLGYRPQVLSLLFYLVLLILIKLQNNSNPTQFLKYNLLILILLGFWVNTHPGFILGLVVYLVFVIIQGIKGQKIYLILPILAVMSVLVNFLGLRIFAEAWHHYQTDLSKLIAEWTGPGLWWQMLIICLTAVCCLAIYKQYRLKPLLGLFYLVILGLSMAISLQAKRHIPFFLLTAFFILENYGYLSRLLTRANIPVQLLNRAFIIVFLFTAVVNLQQLGKINNIENWYCANALSPIPCRQINRYSFLKSNIFTMYEWGGYFIWKIPQSKIFVDGRMPAWITQSGKSPYTIYLEIIQARPGWQTTLAQNKTDLIFIKTGTFLDLKLQTGQYPKWQQSYRDQTVAVYQKN